MVTGTESLRLLHQEFIDQLLCTHKRKEGLKHDLENATTTDGQVRSLTVLFNINYYCHKINYSVTTHLPAGMERTTPVIIAISLVLIG